MNLSFDADEESESPRSFDVRMSLQNGAANFEKLEGVTGAEAKALYTAWKEQSRYNQDTFRTRYEQVRELAKVGLAARKVSAKRPSTQPARSRVPSGSPFLPSPVLSPSTTSAPVGRREGCPCGSGKRYKNCCGRNKA